MLARKGLEKISKSFWSYFEQYCCINRAVCIKTRSFILSNSNCLKIGEEWES